MAEPISLYNTLHRTNEALVPLGDTVTLYCCGPTVYNYQHIGNLRTYVFEDVLARTIRYAGHSLRHVMNITDVGHLVSDADDGEDKMLLASQREGKKSEEIAAYYTDIFFNDCAALNIQRPDIVCKATDHIQEMIDLVSRLFEKDIAYESGGNIYFDVSRCEDYGKLAGLSLDSLQAGARIEVDNAKRNPHDFALWFTKSKFENQELQWDSPWGRGYPGWHIECSAMAMKYLGESFDIHCGGIDHIPVHHTNEIAQSECATGKCFASIWLHGGFLVESSGKMSKSKGEFLTLDSLRKKEHNVLAYRYLCMQSHYRSELAWSWEALSGAQSALHRIVDRLAGLLRMVPDQYVDTKQLSPAGIEHKQRFSEALRNDLNAPQALARLHEMLGDESLPAQERVALTENFDSVLALSLVQQARDVFSDIPEHIQKLAEERDTARFNRDFALADQLRARVLEEGFIIEDLPGGRNIKKAKRS